MGHQLYIVSELKAFSVVLEQDCSYMLSSCKLIPIWIFKDGYLCM